MPNGCRSHSAGACLLAKRVSAGSAAAASGPILANALASFGIKVTYVGALGYPNLHPVFSEFARRAEVHSIAEPGLTDALEFEDGKVMLTKTVSLNEINRANIQARFGRDKFLGKFGGADLVGFVNWTMIPCMSEVWTVLLEELAAHPPQMRRVIFFDLADPQKRTQEDILHALELVAGFEKYFDVVLGLNEKEAFEIAEVMALNTGDHSRDGLCSLALQISRQLQVSTVVIHPVSYALAASRGVVQVVDGPYVAKPLITTGAGDHFNAGFCLGKLCGLDNELSVLTGVTASGFYVRNAQSPSIPDLAEMLRDWPTHQ